MTHRADETVLSWREWVRAQAFDGVIFDLDGTLVDSLPLHLELWNEVLHPLGQRITLADLEAVTGAPLEQIAHHWVGRWDLPVAPAELVRAKRERLEVSWHRLRPHPQGAGLARALYGTLGLAIGTGAPGDLARVMLRVTGLESLFPIVVGADRVRYPKPHPETFLLAAELMRLDPVRLLVVEDGVLGMRAARAAGMRVLDVRDLSAPPVLE